MYSCLFIPNCTRNRVITYTKKKKTKKRRRLARNLVPSFHSLFRQPVRKERPYRVSVLFIQCPIDTIRGTLQFVPPHVVPIASRVSLSSNCTNQMETSQVNLQPKIKDILNQRLFHFKSCNVSQNKTLGCNL